MCSVGVPPGLGLGNTGLQASFVHNLYLLLCSDWPERLKVGHFISETFIRNHFCVTQFQTQNSLS